MGLAVVLAATIVAAARAAEAVPPVRAARVGDSAPRVGAWTEWWRLHGLEPRTGRHFSIEIQTRGVPELRMRLLDPGPFTGASGADQLVERGERTLLDVAALTRTAGGWQLVVNHRRGKAQLAIRGRLGLTAGPWRLGRQPVYDTEPARWERASMTWSALVLAGRVDGWVAWDDVRYDVSGWHAYLDHTWGRLRDHDGAWDHWDRAVSHRGRGESWLLQGLETRPGGGVLDPRRTTGAGAACSSTSPRAASRAAGRRFAGPAGGTSPPERRIRTWSRRPATDGRSRSAAGTPPFASTCSPTGAAFSSTGSTSAGPVDRIRQGRGGGVHAAAPSRVPRPLLRPGRPCGRTAR